ncbi:MAG: hypothetical protein RLZZ136_1862 [Pseudomonadota bacterium]|jgi:hypothetical protein
MALRHSAWDKAFDQGRDDEGYPLGEPLPPPIGHDAGRRAALACVHWARLLQGQVLPTIDQLVLDDLPDIAPHSLVLDLTTGPEAPAIGHLGSELAGAAPTLLLARLADFVLPIQSAMRPIGFAADIADVAGGNMSYQGLLLPFGRAQHGTQIDHILAVLDQRKQADPQTCAALYGELAAQRRVA